MSSSILFLTSFHSLREKVFVSINDIISLGIKTSETGSSLSGRWELKVNKNKFRKAPVAHTSLNVGCARVAHRDWQSREGLKWCLSGENKDQFRSIQINQRQLLKFQNCKNKTAVKLTAVSCPPVVEVKIKRPDTKYQLGFSVQNGVVRNRKQL